MIRVMLNNYSDKVKVALLDMLRAGVTSSPVRRVCMDHDCESCPYMNPCHDLIKVIEYLEKITDHPA